jgi:hypothetical protein
MVPQLHSQICNVLVRIRIRNPNPDPDPEHCSFRYGTYRMVRVADPDPYPDLDPHGLH